MENTIKVHGTDEGKLYINTEELFALPQVQRLIKRVSEYQFKQPEVRSATDARKKAEVIGISI